MTLRDELIQVAAVAVAIVEDLDHGSADVYRMRTGDRLCRTVTSSVVQEVYDERYRQDDKWGHQHHNPAAWLAILAEEVGEAAAEADAVTDWDETPSLWRIPLLDLIQVERRTRSVLGHFFPEAEG